ncbi:MAG: potassium channel family protein [Ilumatobacteraceae bacterium]
MREHLPPGTPILRPVARIVSVAVGMTLLYGLIPLQEGRWWLDVLIGLAAVAAIVPLTAHRVRTMKTTDRPWLVAVEALVLLFTLLIFGFSAVYLTLNHQGTQFAGMDTRVDAAYFTVTTLSTVGFGDIHASGQAGRVAVTVQILVDFTLLAASVRLLLNATRQRVRPGQQ